MNNIWSFHALNHLVSRALHQLVLQILGQHLLYDGWDIFFVPLPIIPWWEPLNHLRDCNCCSRWLPLLALANIVLPMLALSPIWGLRCLLYKKLAVPKLFCVLLVLLDDLFDSLLLACCVFFGLSIQNNFPCAITVVFYAIFSIC